jgi:putative cell wall-binding protein
MKSKTAVLISVLVVLSLAVVAFAAEMQKGTIKDVDIQAGTITFCQEGTTTDMTLKADKSIDLTTVKP